MGLTLSCISAVNGTDLRSGVYAGAGLYRPLFFCLRILRTLRVWGVAVTSVLSSTFFVSESSFQKKKKKGRRRGDPATFF